MPRNLDHFGYARIEFGTPILALRKLEAFATWGLEHVFPVLDEGQTQLRFLHVDARDFSLYLTNPHLHRARLEAVFPDRTITQEGAQGFVDFQHPTTRNEVILEMIDGLTKLLRPETAWLRRRLRGPGL